MFTITRRIEISGAHFMEHNQECKTTKNPCANWVILITCKRESLNHNGNVLDFTGIKNFILGLDLAILNGLVIFNPTAENICKYLYDKIPNCTRVEIQESEGNTASYEKNITNESEIKNEK
jgi:6-pyruvoyltetrahydropterin/6-carboxytetrahydropterin synthase